MVNLAPRHRNRSGPRSTGGAARVFPRSQRRGRGRPGESVITQPRPLTAASIIPPLQPTSSREASRSLLRLRLRLRRRRRAHCFLPRRSHAACCQQDITGATPGTFPAARRSGRRRRRSPRSRNRCVFIYFFFVLGSTLISFVRRRRQGGGAGLQLKLIGCRAVLHAARPGRGRPSVKPVLVYPPVTHLARRPRHVGRYKSQWAGPGGGL